MFYNNHSILVPDPTPTREAVPDHAHTGEAVPDPASTEVDVPDPAPTGDTFYNPSHTEEAVPNPPPTGDVSNPAHTGEVVQEPLSNYQTSAQVAPRPAKLTLETPLDLGKTDNP